MALTSHYSYNMSGPKPKYTIVSYYTKDTYYEQVAREHILKSLHKYSNINYLVKEVPNLGTWQKNTHFKATFIKHCLTNIGGPIVFLDCDAVIQQYPVLFDELDCDIAYHEWKIRDDRIDLLSGTMYFNYNDNVMSMLDDWINELTKSTEWEQKILQQVVKKWASRLRIAYLPGEYCKIFDRMQHITKPAVIEHFQKSRLFRKSNSLAPDATEKLSL